MAIGTPAQRYAKTGLSAQTTTSVLAVSTTIAVNTLAVMMVACGQSKIPTVVVDSLLNPWVIDSASGSGTTRMAFMSCQVATQITSSDTITITWSSATGSSVEAWIYEVASAATSSAFDQAVHHSGSTAAVDTGNTGTLGLADSVVFGITRIAGSQDFTPEGSYSQSANPLRGASTEVAFKVVAATTAVKYSGTWNGADASTWESVGVYKGIASSTSQKTVNSLARASVKTKNGLAIASVKKINGLA